jgi:hypothetical protein
VVWDRQPPNLRRGRTMLGTAQRHFYIFLGFGAGRKSSIFVVWAVPGGRETLSKGGGLRPPPFGRVSRPPGAAQAPKIDDFRPAQKPPKIYKRR